MLGKTEPHLLEMDPADLMEAVSRNLRSRPTLDADEIESIVAKKMATTREALRKTKHPKTLAISRKSVATAFDDTNKVRSSNGSAEISEEEQCCDHCDHIECGGQPDSTSGDDLAECKVLCELGNRVSDLTPREFAAVTGLVPITDISPEGLVFAIQGTEGRNEILCFFCYHKGHYVSACPLLPEDLRKLTLERRDEYYRTRPTRMQERRFGTTARPYAGEFRAPQPPRAGPQTPARTERFIRRPDARNQDGYQGNGPRRQ